MALVQLIQNLLDITRGESSFFKKPGQTPIDKFSFQKMAFEWTPKSFCSNTYLVKSTLNKLQNNAILCKKQASSTALSAQCLQCLWRPLRDCEEEDDNDLWEDDAAYGPDFDDIHSMW